MTFLIEILFQRKYFLLEEVFSQEIIFEGNLLHEKKITSQQD